MNYVQWNLINYEIEKGKSPGLTIYDILLNCAVKGRLLLSEAVDKLPPRYRSIVELFVTALTLSQ